MLRDDSAAHEARRRPPLTIANGSPPRHLRMVQMKRETGFLREEPDERRVPDFAVTFAAHEDAAALRTMAIGPRH